jgi:DnaJ-class molecular chaperone
MDSFNAQNGRPEDPQTMIELTASEAMQGKEVRVPVPGQQGPVTVKIPPGVKDGMRLRLKGIGMPGINGAPRGDFYILLRVK